MKKTRVQCPICKKFFKALVSHISRGHKMKIKDFHKQYPDCILVPNAVRKKISASAKKSGVGNWKKGIKLTEEHKTKISKAVSGKNNPFYGKKHTKETRKKMSDNHVDFSGDKNPFKKWISDAKNKEQWLKSIQKTHDKRKASPKLNKEYRERLSKQSAEAHIAGKLVSYGRGHKNGYFVSKKQKIKIYYRSSYELKFLEWCDKIKQIKSFKPCDFLIPYNYDGIIRRYIPDFIINNTYLIEIKPARMMNLRQNKAKFSAGKRYCKKIKMKYVIISEKELEDLDSWIKNILKK